MCLFEETREASGAPVEPFCNRFAGAFLVPRKPLHDDVRLRRGGRPAALRDDDIMAIARRFRVSRYVVWRRLLDTGAVPEGPYWERLEVWARAPVPRRKPGRAPSRARRCLRQRGRKFASIVFEAKARDLLTYRDALDYLGVRAQDIGNIERLLRGDSVK